MNKDILNSLNTGEKAVDIQEYFYGEAGCKTGYQVTIYTCHKFIFRYIKKYTIPFYFKTKELAQDFLKHLPEIELCSDRMRIGFDNHKITAYYIKFKNKKQKHIYYLYNWDNQCGHLTTNDIWDGNINCALNEHQTILYSHYNCEFLEIFNIEKENTFGEITTYRLYEE